jgi:hypothetical protein
MSGSAVAYADGHLFVMNQGLAAKIPLDKIQDYRWNVSEFMYDSSKPFPTPEQRDRTTQEYKESGLFIDVADIDHPSWQFNSVDEKVLKRWMEIIRQAKSGELTA